jgi:phosphoribosylformylglycinamidine cyclo-ligase
MTDLYALRGVSSGKEDVHRAIRGLDKGLFPQAFCKILPDLAAGDAAYCNIMHADTAGTKTSLAYIYWRETGDLSVWAGIAQDAIVMNLDDMMCAGARGPFLLSSVIARNKRLVTAEVLEALIQGTSTFIETMRQHGIALHLTGGETADVGDIVRTVDVGFTAFARMKREEVIRNEVKVGDVIIGFSSAGQTSYELSPNSGIGCNGLTSARHDLFTHYYADKYPESFDPSLDRKVTYTGRHRLTEASTLDGLDMGRLALSPTRTFAPVLLAMFDSPAAPHIRGLIHNTGGGLTKGLKYLGNVHVVKDNLFEPPMIFQLIQAQSGIADQEMYRTFNMGCRLEVYVGPSAADEILAIADSFDLDAQVIGRVEAATNSPRLSIHTRGQVLEYHGSGA